MSTTTRAAMNEKIQALMQLYDNTLTRENISRSKVENTATSEEQRLMHARWMLDEMQQNAVKGEWSSEKVNRWLGFIQGVLWSSNLFGILALRDQTRNLYTD
jgi:hypothetical protein